MTSPLRQYAVAACACLIATACFNNEETVLTATIQQAPPEVFEETEETDMSETNAPTDAALQTLLQFAKDQNINTDGEWRLNLPQPPQVKFDAESTYYWNLETSEGSIKVKLLPGEAPMHVSSTIYLTQLGFYDGLKFHRIIPGFMAQGGCPLGKGTHGPGYKYAGEYGTEKHDTPGILSMANAGPGTDGSQFFLTFVPTAWLDGKHTIFGRVVDGTGTLETLEGFGSQSGRTSKDCSIVSATITVE